MLKLLMLMNSMLMFPEPGAAGGSALTAGDPPVAPPATPPAGGTPATPPAPKGEPTWRDALPADIKEDATLGKYKDVQALAAAHIALNKHLGADKVILPGKHATDADWKQLFTKLGVPEKVEEYGVKFKDGATIDADFSKQFVETAHKHGVLPKQAQALADWFVDLNTQAEAKFLEQRATEQTNQLKALETELGGAYKPQLALASKFLKEFASKEEIEYLDKTGLGNDVNLIRLFMKAGKDRYGEDVVKGQEKGAASPLLTPADAQKAARAIIGDKANPNHVAYHDASHPNHKAVIQEVQNLFAQAMKKA